MLNGGLVDVLALVPTRMQIYMGDLAAAASGHLQQFTSIEEMVPDSADRTYAVAGIKATA